MTERELLTILLLRCCPETGPRNKTELVDEIALEIAIGVRGWFTRTGAQMALRDLNARTQTMIFDRLDIVLDEAESIVRRLDADAAMAAAKPFDEKAQDTADASITYLGVKLFSRYGKAVEMRSMVEMVTRCGADAGLISEIFCDSKAQYCYTVTIEPWALTRTAKLARLVGGALDFHVGDTVGQRCHAAAIKSHGGHNGITVVVEGGADEVRALWDEDPWWPDDDDPKAVADAGDPGRP
jgi:hypothetical protein